MRARVAVVTLAMGAASVAVALAVASPVHAQCDDIVFASPFVDAFARVATDEYWKQLPANPTDADKSKAADAAISRAHAQYSPFLIPHAVADGLQTRLDENLDIAKRITARVGEVARTDTQEGATSSVSGSSSVANKTGFGSILNWAVEHGAVQKESNGTSTTFSTTPYSLLLLVEEDSDYNFNKYQLLRRLGVAGTFDMDESKSDGSGDFSADKFSAVTTSIRLCGDRSPRTEEFYGLYEREVAGKVREHAKEEVSLLTKTLQPNDPFLAPLKTLIASPESPGPMRIALRDALVRSTSTEESIKSLDLRLRAELCARIVEPIRTGQIDVSGIPRAEVIESATRALQTLDVAQEKLLALQKEYNAKPVVTFKHTWNRADEGTDYSELILAADGQLQPLPSLPVTLLLNATLSLNHDPDEAKDQDTIRDYGIDGSIETSLGNPLRIGRLAESAQRMAVSLTGRFAHQEDADANLGVVQGRVLIPLVRGFGVALALNYNTRTETDSNDEVRVSASVEFNGDKFASLNVLQSLLAGVR